MSRPHDGRAKGCTHPLGFLKGSPGASRNVECGLGRACPPRRLGLGTALSGYNAIDSQDTCRQGGYVLRFEFSRPGRAEGVVPSCGDVPVVNPPWVDALAPPVGRKTAISMLR